jgi:hypothetical protein
VANVAHQRAPEYSGSLRFQVLEQIRRHFENIGVVGNRPIRRQLVHQSREQLRDGVTGLIGRNSRLSGESLHPITAENRVNRIGSNRAILSRGSDFPSAPSLHLFTSVSR